MQESAFLPIWKKNSHLFTVKQVLNFTLDISDGLIINRFTQRNLGEKSKKEKRRGKKEKTWNNVHLISSFIIK